MESTTVATRRTGTRDVEYSSLRGLGGPGDVHREHPLGHQSWTEAPPSRAVVGWCRSVRSWRRSERPSVVVGVWSEKGSPSTGAQVVGRGFRAPVSPAWFQGVGSPVVSVWDPKVEGRVLTPCPLGEQKITRHSTYTHIYTYTHTCTHVKHVHTHTIHHTHHTPYTHTPHVCTHIHIHI